MNNKKTSCGNKSNVAVNRDTLSPPAKIAGLAFPIASTLSKAFIKPITDPKKPNTKPSKLLSTAIFIIFLEIKSCFFKSIKPLIKKPNDSKKQIRISDIKNGPPSLKRSTNGFITEKNNGKDDIIKDITVCFLINMVQT